MWLLFKIYLVLAGIGFPILLFVNFYGNLIPFPAPPSSWGHAHYGVSDPKVLDVLKDIVTDVARQGFRFTWRDGSQMLATFMRDSLTMICTIDKDSQNRGLRGTGRSFPVLDPKTAAEKAAFMLHRAGYNAVVVEDFLPHRKGKIYLVVCDQFLGWELVFRLPDTKMGALPKIISFWR